MTTTTFIKTIALSEAQKDYYLHYLMHPTSPYYNEQLVFQVQERLDASVAIRTLYEITARHEIYRSLFILEDEPMQKVYSEPVLDFEHVASAGWTDTMIRKYLNQEFSKPYKLEEGPLFSFRLLDYQENGSILCFKWHHICTDGWSFSLTIEEFTLIYQQLSTGSTLDLQPLPSQYSDFIEWEQNYVASEEGEAARAFWNDKLGGALHKLELPADHSRPSTPTFQGGISLFTFDRELRHELLAYHKKRSYPIDVVYLSLFIAFLHRLSGQDDIIVGVPRFGRPREDFHSIMGSFVIMLPLRINMKKNISFQELALLVHEELTLCSQYQNYPLSLIVSELNYTRDPKYSSFFQACFVHQKAIKQKAAIILGNARNSFHSHGLTLTPYDYEKNVSQFDVSLIVERDSNNDILAGFEYNQDIFHEHTIAAWIRDFEASSLFYLKHDDEQISIHDRKPKIDYGLKPYRDLPSLKILPEDGMKRSDGSTALELEQLEFSYRFMAEISQLATAWSRSSYTILMTAFILLLYVETEKEDLVIACREGWDEVHDAPIILSLRIDLSGNPHVYDVVQQVHTKIDEAHHNRASFLHGGMNTWQPRLHELQILFEMNQDDSRLHIDFRLRIIESQDQLHGRLTYNVNVFKRDTMQRVLTHYEYVLESMIAQPHQRIREIPSHLNSQFLSIDDYEELFE
ncbi:condensation domain-containing protein [Paenibacillus thiaminolyticus]|uniref:Condensation domain-containing protein n=1 Tax=Paenibacillus thiaminolyticus TaxID=49283 RepID=A0AAP9DQF9_PANTH|nr:condensation domain-containing protein [Paenibacillus thiaminolyticus]MCY9537231.1 condensation domain-containing protein [Paenibacillus thiaminolyticus]MCY9600602.1 condensation domain-containing protein [Paenibacillus thiaminolyticus]MCY9608384.1 condensation domain-containing protein [Paenibacillus thiaminolyticus]MCY9614793.1 condensation domain-containing protein [Paenibacillus thiaminolyticus]MCY9619915.1 condensation domain-containing protein [Paenibacillus thiaminolyticus]